MLGFYWVTAFLSGAGVLVVEMTAPFALAPYFGQAQFVWTNVVGLILFGLAVGNVVGGRLADRHASPRLLAGLILAGAALVAGSAFLPTIVSRATLPDSLPLEAAYPFLLRGSFVATFVCFVPPVLLLGTIAPFLVRCAVTDVTRIGSRAGLLYGGATLGSIAATFLTTYVLRDHFGNRGTLLLAAGLLGLAAVPPLLAGGRRTLAAVAALGAAVVAGASTTAAARAPATGVAKGDLVEAVDGRYQHLEIRRRLDLPVPGHVLAIDEGHDSFQSITPFDGVLTGGLYYDYVNLLAFDAVQEGRLRVAILGFGGGTHARQLLELVGPTCDLSIVGVELDPAVVALARRRLDLRDDRRLRVHTDLDARTFVDHCAEQFDLVYVDCYERQSFLPPHVASREFFEAARRRLAPGGTLALNLFGYGARDPVVEAVASTCASAFGGRGVLCWLPQTANALFYACADRRPRLPREWRLDRAPNSCVELARRLTPRGQAFFVGGASERSLLTDDSGALDRLQVARLAERAARVLGDTR